MTQLNAEQIREEASFREGETVVELRRDIFLFVFALHGTKGETL